MWTEAFSQVPSWTLRRLLLRLVDQELPDGGRLAERRSTAARFPVSKSLEKLNKKPVVDLARCEQIGRPQNVPLLGKPPRPPLATMAIGALSSYASGIL